MENDVESRLWSLTPRIIAGTLSDEAMNDALCIPRHEVAKVLREWKQTAQLSDVTPLMDFYRIDSL